MVGLDDAALGTSPRSRLLCRARRSLVPARRPAPRVRADRVPARRPSAGAVDPTGRRSRATSSPSSSRGAGGARRSSSTSATSRSSPTPAPRRRATVRRDRGQPADRAVDARGEHFATAILADDLIAIECLVRLDDAGPSRPSTASHRLVDDGGRAPSTARSCLWPASSATMTWPGGRTIASAGSGRRPSRPRSGSTTAR